MNFEQDILLSFQDFEDGQRQGWSNSFVDSSQADTDFTRFMGRFDGTRTTFPKKTWSFDPVDVRKFYVKFDFYEIDSWDGDNPNDGVDRFLVELGGDLQEEIDFGWFQRNFQESQEGNLISGVTDFGARYWMFGIEPVRNIGFLDFNDQIIQVLIEVPRVFFATGGEASITIKWDLVRVFPLGTLAELYLIYELTALSTFTTRRTEPSTNQLELITSRLPCVTVPFRLADRVGAIFVSVDSVKSELVIYSILHIQYYD